MQLDAFVARHTNQNLATWTVWAGPSPDRATWTLTASPHAPSPLPACFSEDGSVDWLSHMHTQTDAVAYLGPRINPGKDDRAWLHDIPRRSITYTFVRNDAAPAPLLDYTCVRTNAAGPPVTSRPSHVRVRPCRARRP